MKTVVAVGGFVSLHPGHMKLLEKTIALAEKYNAQSCVLTFDNALGTHKGTVSFMSMEERKTIMKKMGISEVIVQSFDEKFKGLSPEEFVSEILIKKLNCICVVVGENFRFGKNASGNVETLRALCSQNGIECEIQPMKKDEEGNVISTTYLVNIARSGDIEKFSRLLGRPVTVQGMVIHGRHDGRKMGFPTVNVKAGKDDFVPQKGVYISSTEVDGIRYPSVTNIGNAPTFDSEDELTETHIIGVDKDMYGENVMITLYKKIRDITKFDSVESLKKQLECDIITTEKYFENNKNI